MANARNACTGNGSCVSHGVEMPIAQEVHNALFEGKSVQRCLIDLLSRESKDELADFQRWLDQLQTAET